MESLQASILELNITPTFHRVPQMFSHISASSAQSTDKFLISVASKVLGTLLF